MIYWSFTAILYIWVLTTRVTPLTAVRACCPRRVHEPRRLHRYRS
ncbi:MAG: hypothetical protein JWM63_5672 [Gammaproteobacteria bacterium]|nr:hypothetical protein [Gammaproteobacteria bacterium]